MILRHYNNNLAATQFKVKTTASPLKCDFGWRRDLQTRRRLSIGITMG